MPVMSPVRLCAQPGCPDPATYRGRCKAHARANDRGFERVGKRIYNSKRWTYTRRRHLINHPLCERCGVVAAHVHHKQDIANGGSPHDQMNLESLCASCHSKETRSRQLARVGEGQE